MRLLLRSALRDVRTHRGTFAGVVCMAAITSMLFVAFYSATVNLEKSCHRTYEELRFLDFYAPLRPAPRSVTHQVAAVAGVEAVVGRVTGPVRLVENADAAAGAASSGGRLLPGVIIGLPWSERPSVNDVHVDAGSYLSARHGQVLVERRFATAHGWHVGSQVTILKEPVTLKATVVGLVSSPEYIWIANSYRSPRPMTPRTGVLFVSEDDASRLTGLPGVNEVHVRVRDRESRACREDVRRLLAPYLVDGIVERERQPSHAILVHDMRSFSFIAMAFPVISLLLGVVILAGVLRQHLERQRREFGILLAQGFVPLQPGLAWTAISFVLGAGGALAGAVLGVLLGGLATRVYVGTLGLPFMALGVPGAAIAASTAAVGGVAALVAAVTMGLFLRTRPVELLGGRKVAACRMPLVERLVPGLRRLPVLARLPLRNLLRQPLRATVAGLGMAFAVAQVLMTLATFTSLGGTVRFFFEEVHTYSLYVRLREPVPPSQLPPVARWPGVRAVEGCLRESLVLALADRKVERGVLGIGPDARLMRLHTADGQPYTLPDDGPLCLSPLQARELGVHSGEAVRVRLDRPGLRLPERETLVGPPMYEPVPLYPRWPLRRLQQLVVASGAAPPGAVNVLLIDVAPESLAGVQARLDRCPQVDEVTDFVTARADVSSLLRMARMYFTVMLGFSLVLALSLVAATSMTSVLERRREIALMAAQGVSWEEITRLILGEMALLWVVAMAVGLPAGHALGNWLLNHYQSDMVQMTMRLDAASVLVTALLTLLGCGVASLLALREARRTPPVIALADP